MDRNEFVLRDKYYSREELFEIAKQAKISERFFEEYILYVEDKLKYFMESGDFDASSPDLGEDAVISANYFFNNVELALQNGHSEEWARLYVSSYEEHIHAFNNTYQAIFKINPQNAVEELRVYAKSVGGDEFYT